MTIYFRENEIETVNDHYCSYDPINVSPLIVKTFNILHRFFCVIIYCKKTHKYAEICKIKLKINAGQEKGERKQFNPLWCEYCFFPIYDWQCLLMPIICSVWEMN